MGKSLASISRTGKLSFLCHVHESAALAFRFLPAGGRGEMSNLGALLWGELCRTSLAPLFSAQPSQGNGRWILSFVFRRGLARGNLHEAECGLVRVAGRLP
jgi:hypothetical protein